MIFDYENRVAIRDTYLDIWGALHRQVIVWILEGFSLDTFIELEIKVL